MKNRADEAQQTFLTFLFPYDDLHRHQRRHQAFLFFFLSFFLSFNPQYLQQWLNLHKHRTDAAMIELAQTMNCCSDDRTCNDLHRHHQRWRPNGFYDEDQKKKKKNCSEGQMGFVIKKK